MVVVFLIFVCAVSFYSLHIADVKGKKGTEKRESILIGTVGMSNNSETYVGKYLRKLEEDSLAIDFF